MKKAIFKLLKEGDVVTIKRKANFNDFRLMNRDVIVRRVFMFSENDPQSIGGVLAVANTGEEINVLRTSLTNRVNGKIPSITPEPMTKEMFSRIAKKLSEMVEENRVTDHSAIRAMLNGAKLTNTYGKSWVAFYTTTHRVVFHFDNEGNLDNITAEEKYNDGD